MATEIRKISFSNLRANMGELKFVYEEMGHLWLHQHGHLRAVVIPMQDEVILHRAIGLNPHEALHRATVDATRMADAIAQRQRWMSDPVQPLTGGYPPVGMDDTDMRRLQKEAVGKSLRAVARPANLSGLE